MNKHTIGISATGVGIESIINSMSTGHIDIGHTGIDFLGHIAMNHYIHPEHRGLSSQKAKIVDAIIHILGKTLIHNITCKDHNHNITTNIAILGCVISEQIYKILLEQNTIKAGK